MIKTLLKYLVFASVLLFSVNTSAQVYQKFPTNIKYIGGGFNNVNPYFKTLEAALNQVKATATSANPYGFWIASDTLWISDWDSVFTESGLRMKDSIDIYYVATGKIKWMPFGFGGSGSSSGGSTIIVQDDTTLHYGWPTWDQDNIALPIWQKNEGAKDDSIDEEMWRLIVYTKTPLYIENDTLKIDTTGFGGTTGSNLDSTKILWTTGDQAFENIKINAGTLRNSGTIDFISNGNIQLPVSNGAPGTARRIWGNTSKIYYSGSGAADDTSEVALIDFDTKHAVQDTFITVANLAKETKEYFVLGGTATFTLTNSSMDVAVPGMEATSYVIATPVIADSSTAVSALDNVRVIPYAGGFYLKRSLGGTSALKVNWAWIKR